MGLRFQRTVLLFLLSLSVSDSSRCNSAFVLHVNPYGVGSPRTSRGLSKNPSVVVRKCNRQVFFHGEFMNSFAALVALLSVRLSLYVISVFLVRLNSYSTPWFLGAYAKLGMHQKRKGRKHPGIKIN